MDMPYVIRARRNALDMSQSDLAERAGVAVRQLARYEAGQQQPAFNVAQRIAAALGLTLDELAGAYADGLDLSGDWFLAWQTKERGDEEISVQPVQAVQEADRIFLSASGGSEGCPAPVEWQGELRIWDSDTLIGWFATAHESPRDKGTLAFALLDDVAGAAGVWTGSRSGVFMTGRIGLGRTAAEAIAIAEE